MRSHPVDATLEALPVGVAGIAPTQSLGADAHAQTLAASTAPERTPARDPAAESLAPPSVDELPPLALDAAGTDAADLASLELLGEGGMGRVVLARQRSLRRRVAVKSAHARPASARALVHEGVIAGMLEHPNIPPVHALGRDAQGRAVLVMKHIEGVTWAAVLADPAHPLRAQSPLFAGDDLAAHLEVLAQLCNALALAHSQGIVHRDIKPANVMLGRFGEVYLIDWGVAFAQRWSTPGARELLVGTAAYMAPEMVRCEAPDARTDVYLLGATLHEVLTGAPPHAAEDLRGALALAYDSAPPAYPAHVPAGLAELCRRAMSRAREDRPADAREFREALRTFLVHRGSVRLCHTALERRAELAPLLEARHLSDDDAAALARLQHECRVGFELSLREWPENPEARAGLADLGRALAAHELAQGNPRGARAHLASVPEGDPALAAQIALAEARLRDEELARARQLEAERAMDVRTTQRERTIVIVCIAAAVGALMMLRTLWPSAPLSLLADHRRLFRIWLLLAAIGGAGLLLYRRRIQANAVGRIWNIGLAVMLAAMGANRITGLIYLPNPRVTVAADALLAGLGVVLLSLGRRPRAAWAGVPFFGCALTAWLTPRLFPLIVNPLVLLGMLSAAWLWRARSDERTLDATSTRLTAGHGGASPRSAPSERPPPR